MWWVFACSAVHEVPRAAADSAETETVEPSRLACEGEPEALINEVVAANVQGIADLDGATPDWIELRLGATDLEGWGLDDGDSPWTLPALTPGTHALVFASGKDRVDAELHADFELDALGETLYLTEPSGCVADSVTLPRLYADVAYGRAGSGWAYFLEPTPAASNDTESRPGFAATPTLSPAPGFYDSVNVEVSGEGSLLVSTDGAVPERAGEDYIGPIAVDRVTVVRAQALVDGLWPSLVATGTYLVDAGLPESTVRVISLAVDPPDLWDEETGIYTYGTDYEAWYPYFGANFWEPWERDAHVEVFDADGTLLVAQDAGIQIAGGYSRAFDQRNFELLARSGYGPAEFDYPLFRDEDIDSYERLYLRNGGDWCGTQLVDAVVQGVFRDPSGRRYPSVDAQAYEPALVYLDGEFWGLYELKERLDESYIAAHHGEDPDALDRVKVGWTHDANWEVEQGTWDAFDALEGLVAARDLADPDAAAEFAAMVDEKNFASALAAQGWIGNTDFWYNNLRLWKPWREGGKWRWMVYDFGHGWGSYDYDHLSTTTAGTWKGLPVGAALRSSDFRVTFINTHADYLNTTLQGDWARALVESLAEQTRPVIPMQQERWCGGENLPYWESAVAYAATFAARRGSVVEDDLARVFNLERGTLTLEAEGEGRFELTTVTVDPGFVGTYYAGVPVTITPVPAEGWTFLGWEDRDGSSVTVDVEGDVVLRGLFGLFGAGG